MTTAHRPTWAPAKGHEEQGGARMFGPSKKHSKLDDNAHTILKTRAVGQMSVKELVARDCFPGLLAEDELRALTATPRPRVRGRSSSSPTVARLRASPALARAASRVALIVVLRDPIERFVSGMYYYARGVREKKLRGTPPAELTFADLPGVALMRQLLPSGWGYTGSPTCRAWRSCDSSSLW